ncbi:hypothetical protein M413DRAFT_373633 [Hebeloma cylindrosporum]|uniref:Uncharacterized protein n=1 Tax=Hebeloma cylindrosporum TaxID=76867 RepID=A0A0C3C591_HEBCY|nr:hypothetical protein M413DRAFT_373633 [Hebeloma cylindrosporum h7]
MIHCNIVRFVQPPSTTMSSTLPCHVLVSHRYGTDGHLPSRGEVVVIRLSEDLFGPGSILDSGRTLPSGVNRHNYHHAVVVDTGLMVVPEHLVVLTVFPMPAYSLPDPVSGLSSTWWLLEQADDFQQLHIPVPYHASASVPDASPIWCRSSNGWLEA